MIFEHVQNFKPCYDKLRSPKIGSNSSVETLMLLAHFHDADGDLSDHAQCCEYVWIVQNSDNDLVKSCFNRDLIGFTPSLLLNFC